MLEVLVLDFLVLAFLGVIAIEAWAFRAVVFGRSPGSRLLLYAYFWALAIAVVAASFSTFRYEYFKNENTRVCGWPVFIVIFQRDNADAPWLDFVGPTTLLGYPMNVALFMLIPSLLFLGLVYRQNWRASCPRDSN
jgi:hypothetical protein